MAAQVTKRFNAPSHWSLAQRLAHYTAPPNSNGCRLWSGHINSHGYAYLHWEGRPQRANRLVWVEANGLIPDGLHVLHRCDVRNCVEISHFFLGTNAENVADKIAKGRQPTGPNPGIQGERSGRSRLTNADVLAIRAALGTQDGIALRFGVPQSLVSKIKNHKLWKHI